MDNQQTTQLNPCPLTRQAFVRGLRELYASDPDLARIPEQYGAPPFWQRKAGFGTLVRIILEQQVSLASARATFDRLEQEVTPLTPGGLLNLNDKKLKAIGFSRQKITYCRILAQAVLAKALNLSALAQMPDEMVRTQLTALKGIGLWTANIYLLTALRRPDIWPSGDLALAVAVQRLKGLPARPDAHQLRQISDGWAPWRAVAARLLWHFYLSLTASPSKGKVL